MLLHVIESQSSMQQQELLLGLQMAAEYSEGIIFIAKSTFK